MILSGCSYRSYPPHSVSNVSQHLSRTYVSNLVSYSGKAEEKRMVELDDLSQKLDAFSYNPEFKEKYLTVQQPTSNIAIRDRIDEMAYGCRNLNSPFNFFLGNPGDKPEPVKFDLNTERTARELTSRFNQAFSAVNYDAQIISLRKDGECSVFFISPDNTGIHFSSRISKSFDLSKYITEADYGKMTLTWGEKDTSVTRRGVNYREGFQIFWDLISADARGLLKRGDRFSRKRFNEEENPYRVCIHGQTIPPQAASDMIWYSFIRNVDNPDSAYIALLEADGKTMMAIAAGNCDNSHFSFEHADGANAVVISESSDKNLEFPVVGDPEKAREKIVGR